MRINCPLCRGSGYAPDGLVCEYCDGFGHMPSEAAREAYDKFVNPESLAVAVSCAVDDAERLGWKVDQNEPETPRLLFELDGGAL